MPWFISSKFSFFMQNFICSDSLKVNFFSHTEFFITRNNSFYFIHIYEALSNCYNKFFSIYYQYNYLFYLFYTHHMFPSFRDNF